MGWLLVGLALIVMPPVGDVFTGRLLALFMFSLFGVVAVIAGVRRQPDRIQQRKPIAQRPIPARRWISSLRGVAALVMPMIAAMGIAAALVRMPIGRAGDRVAIGTIAVPLLWAGFLAWVIADPNLRRPVITLAIMLTIAAGALTVSVLA